MYNRLLVKSEEILRLYNEGMLLNDISSATSTSTVSVKKVLLNYVIDYNKIVKEQNSKKLELIVELYRSGISQVQLEKEYKITRKTLRELLKPNNEIRTKSEQHHIRYQTEINHNAFDELTPESLYWIGMLYTDGHIEEKECSVELVLHNNDIDHLYKLKNFLQSNRKVDTSKRSNCSRFRFNSERIRNRLMELGFTHNKTLTLVPHELLKNSRDFWRGCIDGDGGVYDYKTDDTKVQTVNELFLCGTLETIFEFIIFCSKYCNIKNKYPSKANGKNLYQVHYYSEDASKIIKLLYEDSSTYLERKYQKYLTIIK